MRMWIKRHRRKLLVGLLVLLTAAWMTSWPSVQWRTLLLSLKMHGLLPRHTWSELLLGSHPEEQLGEVPWVPPYSLTVKQQGEGPCTTLWETPMGEYWGRESDKLILGTVLGEQFFQNIYERGPVAIHKDDVVFDAGSHLGAFTRLALQRGAGLVVAFEPDSTNIACYKRTFAREIAEGRVILVEAALWEEPGTLNFTTSIGHSAGGTVFPVGGSPSHLVPATTIDETVTRLNLDRLDFIKMDIEGSERHALRGGRQSIARFRPQMAICIYHRSDDPVAVPEAVSAAESSYSMLRSRQVFFFY